MSARWYWSMSSGAVRGEPAVNDDARFVVDVGGGRRGAARRRARRGRRAADAPPRSAGRRPCGGDRRRRTGRAPVRRGRPNGRPGVHCSTSTPGAMTVTFSGDDAVLVDQTVLRPLRPRHDVRQPARSNADVGSELEPLEPRRVPGRGRRTRRARRTASASRRSTRPSAYRRIHGPSSTAGTWVWTNITSGGGPSSDRRRRRSPIIVRMPARTVQFDQTGNDAARCRTAREGTSARAASPTGPTTRGSPVGHVPERLLEDEHGTRRGGRARFARSDRARGHVMLSVSVSAVHRAGSADEAAVRTLSAHVESETSRRCLALHEREPSARWHRVSRSVRAPARYEADQTETSQKSWQNVDERW